MTQAKIGENIRAGSSSVVRKVQTLGNRLERNAVVLIKICINGISSNVLSKFCNWFIQAKSAGCLYASSF